MITTLQGLIPVEELSEGQMVLTRDNGYQPVRWIGQRKVTQVELKVAPEFQPVKIAKGALSPGVPEKDLVVSPQHRMVVESAAAQLMLGQDEVFVKAKDLLHKPGVSRCSIENVTYLHVMFDAHEVILADNAWTESFQPSATVGDTGDAEMLTELLTLFPDLSNPSGLSNYVSARSSTRWFEARLVA